MQRAHIEMLKESVDFPTAPRLSAAARGREVLESLLDPSELAGDAVIGESSKSSESNMIHIEHNHHRPGKVVIELQKVKAVAQTEAKVLAARSPRLIRWLKR